MRYTSILRASVVLVFVIAMGLIVTLPWAGKAAAAEGKTLKIGVLLGLGNPLGRDTQKLVEAVSEAVNKKGGLTIGGEKYHIQLILYDNKDSAETARAGAERLVFQDGVKFILGDTTADAWLPVTEANKVVAIVTTPSPAAVNARLKYTFQASFLNTGTIVNWGWFCGAFPAKKKLGGLFADGLAGHGDAKQLEVLSKVFGLDMSDHVFYPAGTTDFSALATRIKSGEPQVFTTAGTGPRADPCTQGDAPGRLGRPLLRLPPAQPRIMGSTGAHGYPRGLIFRDRRHRRGNQPGDNADSRLQGGAGRVDRQVREMGESQYRPVAPLVSVEGGPGSLGEHRSRKGGGHHRKGTEVRYAVWPGDDDQPAGYGKPDENGRYHFRNDHGNSGERQGEDPSPHIPGRGLRVHQEIEDIRNVPPINVAAAFLLSKRVKKRMVDCPKMREHVLEVKAG